MKILDEIAQVLRKLPISLHTQIQEFDRNQLFALCEQTLSADHYQSLQANELNTQAREYLSEVMSPYDIYIGIELSDNTKAIFDKLGIMYIDFWVSPLRFYKDIMFEFYSSDHQIATNIQKYAIDESLLFQQVDSLRTFSKEFLPAIDLKANSCLLIGQMMQDKSVLRDGHFLHLADFNSQISDLAARFTHIYILKHPYLQDQVFARVLAQLTNINNISVLKDANTYQLLLQPEIEHVAGISSSVLTEAHYFGKDTTFFHKAVIDERYTKVFADYFTSGFWASLLSVPNIHPVSYYVQDNFFRHKYAMEYSFKLFMPDTNVDLTEEKNQYQTVVNLYRFIEQLDKNKSYILFGLGSVGKLIFPHIQDQLVAIVDKSLNKRTRMIKNIPIIASSDIASHTNASVLVSAFKYNASIQKELKAYDNEIIIIEGL